MFSPQIIIFLVATTVLAFAGLISNAFIVTVMIIVWTESRSLSSIEQLLLSLALTNCWISVLLTPFHINEYVVEIFTDLTLQIFFATTVFLVSSRFWFTAWLCVFYCIKIVNSTQSFVLWCKMKISWLIPRFLMGSLVLSLIVSFGATWDLLMIFQGKSSENFKNMTQRERLKHTLGAIEFIFLVLGSSCPFLIVLFCSLLVVSSLCRHVCRLMGKKSNFRSLQTEAHIKAAGTVLSLMFLYASFYLAYTLSMIVDMRTEQNPHFVALVFIIYSPAQAVILVLNNPKLKQAAIWMLPKRKT